MGFVASFVISLRLAIWILFSELFPSNVRRLTISVAEFVNSVVSFLVRLLFFWELTNLENALTFVIYGLFPMIGFLLIVRLLPETKGKTLEEIKLELVGEIE